VPTALAEKVANAPTNTNIVINWGSPTSDGGSAVTGWKVYSDKGTGSASTLLTTITSAGTKEWNDNISALNTGGNNPTATAAVVYGLTNIP